MQLQMLIALAMVGYLAAVTQSPITSFVIVMEMINGHALVISLMATALISSRVARLFAPPLYEALALRYMTPAAAHAAPVEPDTPKTLEPLFDDEKAPDGKDAAQP
jgi:H+/Cl- antiporter ClcA